MMSKHFFSWIPCVLLLLILPTPSFSQVKPGEILEKAVQRLGGTSYMDVLDIFRSDSSLYCYPLSIVESTELA